MPERKAGRIWYVSVLRPQISCALTCMSFDVMHLPQFVVLSYTTRKLLIYEKEDDMGSAAVPHLTLEFPQIYNVRLLKAGEHESVRVKANDAKRVLLLAYIDQAGEARKSHLPVPSEDSVSCALVDNILVFTLCVNSACS